MTESMILYVYGGLMIFGGVIGFITAKSRPSLIAGVASGLLLVIGGFLSASGSPAGFYIGVIGSIVLTTVFILRLMKTKSFFPSGMMLLICIIFLILLLTNR